MRTRSRRIAHWPLAPLACGILLLSGCADFDGTPTAQDWKPAPELTPQAGPQPELPGAEGTGPSKPGPSAPPTSVPPPQGCKDFDEAVIGTCLDTVAAVAALPGGQTPAALAGERKSGRVFQVTSGAEKEQYAELAVDSTGGGGLTGLALSPSFAEDQLVFAYVTTPTDNRVVRFAKGQQPKPVLTGIPRGGSGNAGSLTSDGNGALLVATGNAGNPAASADPNSLAGKVLRIDTSGQPAQGNPNPSSAVLASGLTSPGGLCKSPDGSRLWVTDRAADKDVLHRVVPGQALTSPAWTWPDRPGVAGCVDGTSLIMVATSTAGNMQNLPIATDGSISGKPSVTLDGQNNSRTYGRLAGMEQISAELAVAGTVNKDGGEPISSDDRVVLIVIQPSAAIPGKD
ncbi:PQQ-dependent sugar dehydrogenase [Amycolatopsis lurida]